MPEPLVPSPGSVSRRSVIGLGLGLAGLGAISACSSGTAAVDMPRVKTASVTPDVQTATEALAAVRVARQAVVATGQKFPALHAGLARLDAMHAAHERSLVDAVPAQARASATPAPYVVPGRRDAALARLQASEDTLRTALQALALRAQSGEFARLLASMAAAVTVHRPALSTASGAGS